MITVALVLGIVVVAVLTAFEAVRQSDPAGPPPRRLGLAALVLVVAFGGVAGLRLLAFAT